MSHGNFVNFLLPFVDKAGSGVSNQNQAEAILNKSRQLVKNGSKGVAITYSANYGQTREIQRVYFAGGWNTHTTGANQAAVMQSMESLMGKQYQDLQGKMRILPITTMNAYHNPVSPWNNDVHMGIVITDLERIKIYLEGGWDVLGWQNQTTVGTTHPYAIGGGIASLPPAISDHIQTTLSQYFNTYN